MNGEQYIVIPDSWLNKGNPTANLLSPFIDFLETIPTALAIYYAHQGWNWYVSIWYEGDKDTLVKTLEDWRDKHV